MKYVFFALSLILVIQVVGLSTAQEITTGENMTRARTGAGYTFPVAYELLPASPLVVLGVSADETWYQVESDGRIAWINRASLTLPETLTFSTLATPEPVPSLSTENCISLVGDSVAYGTVVYVVPGHGFGVLRLTPLGEVLQETLIKRGLEQIEVRDRTASAAFLSEAGKFPYFDMPEYAALQADQCRFTIIMPWINDLSVERPRNISQHLQELTAFIEELRQTNPDGEFLVLGFYYGEPSDFAAEHAAGYTDENVAEVNELLTTACQEDFSAWSNVHCLPTENLFADLENAHVVRGATREQLEATLYEPIPSDVAPFFEVYWRDNPQGEVYGDGVHLNTLGKNILAQALISQLLKLAPNL